MCSKKAEREAAGGAGSTLGKRGTEKTKHTVAHTNEDAGGTAC